MSKNKQKKVTISKEALAAFNAKKAIKGIDQTCKALGMNKVERMLVLDGVLQATYSKLTKMEKSLTSKQHKALKKALGTKKITNITRM